MAEDADDVIVCSKLEFNWTNRPDRVDSIPIGDVRTMEEQ